MGKVVFLAAIMDMLHQGHKNLLEKMREEAGPDGKVIVILHDDKSCYEIKGKFPVQKLRHRIRNVKDTGLVDKVMTTKSVDPAGAFYKIILRHRHFGKKSILYMRGDDMKEGFPGQWLLEKYNVPIKFVKYTKGVSSTKRRDEL